MKRHIEALESRRLLSAVIDEQHPFTFTDADGSTVTLRMVGPGSATVESGSTFGLSMSKSTTSGTTLSIDVTGGDGRTTLAGLTARAPLRSISGKAVDFAGAIAVKSVETFETRTLSGATLNAGWLGTLTAKRIGQSLLVADRIGRIEARGDFDTTRVHVSPVDDSKAAIQSIVVKGTIRDSTIFALGDIGSVAADAMISTNLTAGVRFSRYGSARGRVAQPLPNRREGDDLYDFTGTYRIERVSIGTSATAPDVAFSYSIIGAHHVGDVTLRNVNGTASADEFGVAGYTLGRVKRSFDAANTFKETQAWPDTAFKIRQISVGTSGSGGSGPITSAGTINVTPPWPTENLEYIVVGSVTNHASSSVVMVKSGEYQLRNNKGKVIARAASLPAIIHDLFADAGTSIKVEDVRGTDLRFMATSVGPQLRLERELLGRQFERRTVQGDVPTTGLYRVYGSEPVNGVRYTVPEFPRITADLKQRRNKVLVFKDALKLVKQDTSWVGSLHSVASTGDILLEPSLQFSAAGISRDDLPQLIRAATDDRIGRRRLPPRWVNFEDQVVVYGLPNGATASFRKPALDTTYLNATGKLLSLGSTKHLQDDLRDAGLL